MKNIIVYYSRTGENYVNGVLQELEKGNTQIVAELIMKNTGADIFKLEQEEEYSWDYNECIAQAKEDQKGDKRPVLKKLPDDMDGYDTVYLGYPNYWGTMPMAVFTFLEAFDLSGKTIMPFCTHEGSGMGRSEKDIKKACPESNVKEGLAIKGSEAAGSEKEIKSWL